MAKVRLEISKGDEIRFLSHLDYARTIERAVRRSKLPVAYSEGFNPHMKVAYASALSVGVASRVEYMDMDLSESLEPAVIKECLEAQFPEGIVLRRLKYVADRTPALMAVVNLSVFCLTVPVIEGADEAQIKASINAFNRAASVIYVRQSPKGRREIDIKQFMDCEVTAVLKESAIELGVCIRMTPTGSVKPSEVLAALVDIYGLSVKKESAFIDRLDLFIADGEKRITPMEVV